ncbi:Ig-like domain-containing protein [Paenibacillus azoreducens]|uniref:S-layer homology domain-containing protein n=1 Tax=Paenibacillus azoreducens TaxID=116718 RepID=UPI0039F62BD0
MGKQKQFNAGKKNVRRLQTSLLTGALIVGSIPGLAYAEGSTANEQFKANDHLSSGVAGTRENPLTNRALTAGFSDLNGLTSSEQDIVQKAVNMGLLEGDSSGHFRPNEVLTRQELAVLLARALHLPLSDAPAPAFADVTESNWSASCIEAVKRAGLMAGEGSELFHPHDPVTREELAAVFVRAVNGTDARGGQIPRIQDRGQVSSWAASLVDTALRLELIDATDEKLHPQSSVSRKDIASFLLDVFHTEEQTAAITKVDGDLIFVDGSPYLVAGKLKQLLGERNREALEGAVLKYKSANHNLNDLSELEIVKDGVVLDASGTSYGGSVKISGEGVTVRGDALGQVLLTKGLTNFEADAKIKMLIVDGGQAVQLKGKAQIETLQITNSQTKLTIGSSVGINEVQLPKDVKLSQVIKNLDQVRGQIKHVQIGIDDRYSPNPVPSTSASNPSPSQNPSPSPNPTPTPTPSNHAPTVKTAISPVTTGVTDGVRSVSLVDVFADEDQDALTYSAVSSNTGVAAVGVNGASLAITPVNAGTATITVTANDGKGGRVQTQFIVTVKASPPHGSGIPDQRKEIGTGDVFLSLNSFFTAADNAPLTYEISVGDPSITAFTLNADQLVLSPLQVGSTTVTVKASDGRGGTQTQSFQLYVTGAANRNPVVKQTPNNRTITVGEDDYIIDLSTVFDDPDQDTLTYEAISLDPSLAAVSVNGTQAAVHALASGMTTIQLKAKDGNGGEATTEFQVTVNKPLTIGTLPAQTLQVGDAPITLDLSPYLTDPDQGILTVTATSAAANIATIYVSGQKVTLTPVAAGSTTVTITVTDGRGGTATSAFAVTVKVKE